MRNGSCPECNSTDVYCGNTREAQGGLRDEHQVYIPTNGAPLYVETYICLACGHVRLFLDEESKAEAAVLLRTDKDWTKAS